MIDLLSLIFKVLPLAIIMSLAFAVVAQHPVLTSLIGTAWYFWMVGKNSHRMTFKAEYINVDGIAVQTALIEAINAGAALEQAVMDAPTWAYRVYLDTGISTLVQEIKPHQGNGTA
jgi:hypothetical protein